MTLGFAPRGSLLMCSITLNKIPLLKVLSNNLAIGSPVAHIERI